MRQSLVRYAAALGVGIFLVNLAANKFYWYTAIFGFDKVMHTFGGIFIVLLVSSMYIHEIQARDSWQVFVALVLAAFVVGLFWEYYEYIVQAFIKTVHLADIPDSIGDLIFDVIGGCIGACFVIWKRKRYNTLNERTQNA